MKYVKVKVSCFNTSMPNPVVNVWRKLYEQGYVEAIYKMVNYPWIPNHLEEIVNLQQSLGVFWRAA